MIAESACVVVCQPHIAAVCICIVVCKGGEQIYGTNQ